MTLKRFVNHTDSMDSKSIENHKLIERIKAHKYNVCDKRGNCSLYGALFLRLEDLKVYTVPLVGEK